MTRRGTRIVTGYVVSLSGKRGGPWAAIGTEAESKVLDTTVTFVKADTAAMTAEWWRRNGRPSARVLPVVRYELDREEECLRDAVVEAAIALSKTNGAEPYIWAAYSKMEDTCDTLRAHLEKKR